MQIRKLVIKYAHLMKDHMDLKNNLLFISFIELKDVIRSMKNLKIESVILLICLLAVFVIIGKGQVPDDDTPIKVSTYLVNIPVTASDRNGRNISGLKKENFSIFQDGIKQEIAYFADEEAPMNVAILIDTSGSTMNVLGDIKEAAYEFVKLFRLEDKAMIV